MNITIRGKQYTARFISLFQLKKTYRAGQTYGEAEKKWFEDQTGDEALSLAFNKAWIEYCGTYLEEDTSDLAMDKITPTEHKELQDFFYSVVAAAVPKSKESGDASGSSAVT